MGLPGQKLSAEALEWAIKHLGKEGDTDLFPHPFEIEVLSQHRQLTVESLKDLDITNHTFRPSRKFLIPKGHLTFRSVTQLDPLDSIIFSAIMFAIGKNIEARRRPRTEHSVFSYRFHALSDGSLYSKVNSWARFWRASKEKAKLSDFILVTDIIDFYNQIYHHTIENQLDECGVDKAIRTTLIRLLQQTTDKVSRGIPVGPHAAHLIAEMSLIPIDNFMKSIGVEFCRFVDDIHIFCDSELQAQTRLHKIAQYLDRTQKMILNRQKTAVLSSSDFQRLCDEQLLDRPINNLEGRMLAVIRKHSSDPYRRIKVKKLTPAEQAHFSGNNINAVFSAYFRSPEVEYTRLRWFIRRLAQVGAPGGVEYCIKNFSKLAPAVAEISDYLKSAEKQYEGSWRDIGKELIDVYGSELVQANEYLRIVLLGIFSKLRDLNHVTKLAHIYDSAQPSEKRKIILAAAELGNTDWVRQFKGDYLRADPWTSRAIVYAMRVLPKDEREKWAAGAKAAVKDQLSELLLKCVTIPAPSKVPRLAAARA